MLAMEENKEIIKFIKDNLKEARRELYLTEVISESVKEYENHREIYLKNKWTCEDIGRVLAKIMIMKVKPLTCECGNICTTI
jgi:hypothetical protein